MIMDISHNTINLTFWAKEIIHDKNLGWVDKDIANWALQGVLLLACGIDSKRVNEIMEKKLKELQRK